MLDKDAERKLKRKFELAYFLWKQNLSFTKMAPLCTLEEKHGAELGSGYKNDKACATFSNGRLMWLRDENMLQQC